MAWVIYVVFWLFRGTVSINDQIVHFLGFRSQSKVLGGIIICALRSKDDDHAYQMAELAGKYLQKQKSDPCGVIGFDIAGDEGNYPLNSSTSPMMKGDKLAAVVKNWVI